MTKERLEELIKQEGTVYEIHKLCRYIVRLKLSSSNYVSEDGCYLYNRCESGMVFSLDNLYESKEQAEWALKTVAERTERFEPPMWEEIKRFYGFSFYGNVIDELYHREEYRFFVDKLAAITVVDISKKQPFRDVYSACSTKENYEKACEIVRDLFKGEK